MTGVQTCALPIYIRQGVRVPALIVGGGQEKGLRAGTENTAGIIGMGLAAAYAKENMEANAEKTRALRDKLIEGILAKIPEVRLNGHPTDRLPNNVNVSIRYIEGEGLLLLLDHMGIAASSGSACTSGLWTRRMFCWLSDCRMRDRKSVV